MFLLLVLLLCALIVYFKLIKPTLYWQVRGVFHVKPWIRFAKVFLTDTSFIETIREAYDEFPDRRYYGSYQFLRPAMFLRDLELIKQVTVKDFEYFTDHVTFTNEQSDPLMGQNLFALKGQKWRDMRSTLSPAFTSTKMKAMFILIKETAQDFVQHFFQKQEEIIILEMKDAYTRYTNDVIATCAFGIKCDSLNNPDNEFFSMGKAATSFNGLRAIVALLNGFFPKVFEFFRIPLLPTFVSNFFTRVVKDTITTREKQGIIRPDMIHLLMEARKGKLTHDKTQNNVEGFATVDEAQTTTHTNSLTLTDDLITAQALVFFFAGFETSSTVLSFMSYELALNPEIQKKLQLEIDEASSFQYEEILQMKYLDQVVSETLRKWPPGFILSRICVKDYIIQPTVKGEKGQLIEKGCLLSIPVYGIHMDEKYFPEPDRFDPDRFSEENKDNIVSGSYFPFGIGPRNCIGSRFALLEVKTLIVIILSKFDIVVVEKTRIPVRLTKTLNIGAKDGFWLGLRKRKNIFSS